MTGAEPPDGLAPRFSITILSCVGGRIVLRIRNGAALSQSLIVEPWGHQHALEPGAAVDIVGEGPAPPQLEISYEESWITVYGWEGSNVVAVAVERDGAGSHPARTVTTPPTTPPGTWDLATRSTSFAQSLPDTTSDPVSAMDRFAADWERNRRNALNGTDEIQCAGVDTENGGAQEYFRIMNSPDGYVGRARSLAEMQFAASLVRCENCGEAPGALHLEGAGDRWALVGLCPHCSTWRELSFWTQGEPIRGAYPRFELGGGEPSEIIYPCQFMAELDRLQPQIQAHPTTLEPDTGQAYTDAADRALTCLNELLKFVPTEHAVIAERFRSAADSWLGCERDLETRPGRYQHSWLANERDRILELKTTSEQ